MLFDWNILRKSTSNRHQFFLQKVLKSTNVCKAAGIDHLSDCSLKDGSRVLSKTLSELYNLSFTLRLQSWHFFKKKCPKLAFKLQANIAAAFNLENYWKTYPWKNK